LVSRSSFALSMPVEAEEGVTSASPKHCNPGLHRQADGPFAVMLFCEDALGSYLGIIYYQNMGAPREEKWNLADRFWQHPDCRR